MHRGGDTACLHRAAGAVHVGPGRYAVSFAGPFRTPSATLAHVLRLSPAG